MNGFNRHAERISQHENLYKVSIPQDVGHIERRRDKRSTIIDSDEGINANFYEPPVQRYLGSARLIVDRS